ncbi:MAG: hypothetical protein JST32_01420 [Bacteroidetes bacterium]|nr:hypothetical protein [Bacteroidota bacterium]
MNWLHFFLWVAGVYALYYLVMILTDLAGGKGSPAKSFSPELTFSEAVPPAFLKYNAEVEADRDEIPAGGGTKLKKQAPEVIASGGVSLRDLFSLARQEAIIYTNSVGY